MLKLVVSGDLLSINDGGIILSKWTSESHYGKVFIKDFYGDVIASSKMPIETQNGERIDAADVIADIGANFKGVNFGYYYQWVFTGKSNEISGSSYLNYGWGGTDANLTIVSGTMEGKDLIVQWPSGHAGFFALSQHYGLGWYGDDLNTPLDVDWATLSAYKCYPQYIFDRTTNVISRLKINETQDVFLTKPTLYNGEYVFLDQSKAQPNNYNLVMYGNSITFGSACSPTNPYPSLLTETLQAMNQHNYTFINRGVNGYHGYEMLANWETDLFGLYDPNKINMIFLFEFYNDLNTGGQTVAQAYQNIFDLCTALKSAGWIVNVMTAPESRNDVKDANNLLRANYSSANYLIDQAIDLNNALMINPTYSCDGTHLTQAGIQVQVNYIFNDIFTQSIIPTITTLNNVEIKNTMAVYFDGTAGNYALTPFFAMPNAGTIEVIFNEKYNTDSAVGLFSPNTLNPGAYKVTIRRESGGTIKYYFGSLQAGAFIHTKDNKTHVLKFRYDYDNKLYYITLDDVYKGHGALTATMPTATNRIILGGYSTSYRYNCIYSRIRVNNSYNDDGIDILDLRCNAGNFDKIYDYSVNGLHATINTPLNNWTELLDDAKPLALTDDSAIWVNGSNYIIAPIGHAVTEVGYTKLDDFSNFVGILKGLSNTYTGIQYSGLETDVTSDDILTALDLVIPPKEDFQVDNSGDIVKNLVAEPYEQHNTSEGNITTTSEGDELWVIKTF